VISIVLAFLPLSLQHEQMGYSGRDTALPVPVLRPLSRCLGEGKPLQ